MRRFRQLLILVLGLGLSLPLPAARPPSESWTFTFRLENDLFGNTDRFYTNGIKLSWISPEIDYFRDLEWLQKDTRVRELANRFIDILPFSRNPEIQRNVALSMGQKMFTPTDIAARDLITADRPYAGWLYGSVAFHNKDDRKLDTIEIQGGLIGEWSLAEQAQDLVHDLRGIGKANGWDNQIGNELGIAFIYDRKDRVVRRRDIYRQLGFDVITHAGGAVGSVFTNINAGVEIRFGWNIPTDFGTALIRPAGDTNAPSDTNDPRYSPDGSGFSFHLFGAATGRMVIRDIFLDGSTFSSSHSVDKELLVGDFVVGASLIYNRFKLSYAQVVRTREFELQASGHNFGSISLSFTY